MDVVLADNMSMMMLQHRLNKIDNFYGYFIQKISDVNGIQLEVNEGELWIKRPNLLHWHMIVPEENFLISDGNTLWFYVPAINQVTAYLLENITDNIFFMLFVNNDQNQWNDYIVLQQGNDFIITPKIYNNVNLKECKITITDDGLINRFSILENNKQYIDYYVFNHSKSVINADKFHFNIFQDVQLDDQRS